MPDAVFADPRLDRLYDPMEGSRDDLDAYEALVAELGARSVLDVGCGTGVLALRLAARGVDVTGVDPAAASLAVARSKPGGERVRWVDGDAADALPTQVDLVVMTGNVAQVFVEDSAWADVLATAYAALRPGGHLVFETRRPEAQAWREWTREASYTTDHVPGVGDIVNWVELLEVTEQLVSFRWTFQFAQTGEEITSDSTLRFRTLDVLTRSLAAAGLDLVEVREAPDRPGREMVVIARRPG